MAVIAVLFHEFERNPAQFVVHQLAEFWREAGHQVIYLFGTRQFVPADLVLVHVNLSVVPVAYREFAGRFPVALNEQVLDIRKSTRSESLLGRGDAWSGPVIVKSDLNYGGLPEKAMGKSWLERRSPLARRLRAALERRFQRDGPFVNSSAYHVLPSLADVPPRWFSARDVVVEKFTPEMENDLYHLRICQVLGERWVCTRLASREPIIKAGNSISATDIEPHPMVDQWRRTLGLDYGKLDYVVVDDRPILLDVNKTTGATTAYRSAEELSARRRYLAEGIYAFLG